MTIAIHEGDCLNILASLPDELVHSVVTDPPYGIRFGESRWDYDIPSVDIWREVLRVLRPGGYLLSFASTRTYHRMAVAIEDAGFEIKDQIGWLYGTGFPRSEKLTGEWDGWGSALKPCWEPIIWARKPFNVVPQDDTINNLQCIIEAFLWSIAPAKLVEHLLGLSQTAFGRQSCDSVRWLVAVLRGMSSIAPSDMMAMFNSPEEASTFLSIALLWNNILGESFSSSNTSITETASSVITALKTLKCLISAIIPENIIKAATLTHGQWWNAGTAVSGFHGIKPTSRPIQRPIVAENVMTPIASAIINGLVSVAESCFPHLQVIIDDSAHPLVITNLVAKVESQILSPALEPVVVARKPLIGTIQANIDTYGAGGLNIDACRIPTSDKLGGGAETMTRLDQKGNEAWTRPWMADPESQQAHAARVRANVEKAEQLGRWPGNIIHDGSEEVMESFAVFGERKACMSPSKAKPEGRILGGSRSQGNLPMDSGTAARYFFCAKASKADRAGSAHPTVKPVSLMRYLCRLVTAQGGTVLDPFAGSGTTGQAAVEEGFSAILIEREAEYCRDIRRRLAVYLDDLIQMA